MPSFKDALKNYKTTTAATPAVNPPEAPAIMEEKTVPETEGKAETEPLAVSKPAPKTRAPRGSKKASAEPTASTASAPATEAPESEDELGVNAHATTLLQMGGENGHAWAVDTRVLVAALFDRGYGVTRL